MIGNTLRFGLTTWTTEDDPVVRGQFNSDHIAIDAKVVIDYHGDTLADRPASPPQGTWWTADDTHTVYRYDGTTWHQVTTIEQPIAVTMPVAQSWGATAVIGTSNEAVRSDHVHAIPSHTAADHAIIPLSAFGAPNGPVSFGGQRVMILGSPSAAQDIATKAYVDAKFA